MPIKTLADINRRSREFWAEETSLLTERLSNEVLRIVAFKILQDEETREVPVKFRKCLNAALADASNSQSHFATMLGRKGGQASKRDTLQRLIEHVVENNHEISVRELFKELKSRQAVRDVVDDIDETSIHFINKGRVDAAPIRGLKDRLSRAKKTLRSR
jgi:hypothetical protein